MIQRRSTNYRNPARLLNAAAMVINVAPSTRMIKVRDGAVRKANELQLHGAWESYTVEVELAN
jgi:hypothetical protein